MSTARSSSAPQVGDTGTFTIEDQVIVDSLTQVNFGDDVANEQGVVVCDGGLAYGRFTSGQAQANAGATPDARDGSAAAPAPAQWAHRRDPRDG